MIIDMLYDQLRMFFLSRTEIQTFLFRHFQNVLVQLPSVGDFQAVFPLKEQKAKSDSILLLLSFGDSQASSPKSNDCVQEFWVLVLTLIDIDRNTTPGSTQ